MLRTVTDAAPLEAARAMLGMTVRGLWLESITLGANVTLGELSAFLNGGPGLSNGDYDRVVHALNEQFMDRGEDHPLSYAEDLTPS